MYAVIKTGGKQYKVSEGNKIKVEKLPYEVNDTVALSEVLLVAGDGEVKTGKPFVEGAKVTATVVSHGKGVKTVCFKYTSKSGFHKKSGHRQCYTELLINKIEG